jgi:hypothetical protein
MSYLYTWSVYSNIIKRILHFAVFQVIIYIWCDFDCASSLICGNKMPTGYNRRSLLQILLLAQHVSGTTMPIIRSSRVLYRLYHLYNTLKLLMMGIVVPEACWASNKICNKDHLLHLGGILLPHINNLHFASQTMKAWRTFLEQLGEGKTYY